MHLTDPRLPAEPARAPARLLALLVAERRRRRGPGGLRLVVLIGSASATALYGTALQQQCTAVADVLSDGPDPTPTPSATPQAQVLPLRQLKITDTALQPGGADAGHRLPGLQHQHRRGQAPPPRWQASKAEAAVNAICPGAAN